MTSQADTAGVRFMAVAAFFFSLMSLQVKLVGGSLPNQEIVLIRSLLVLLLSWAALRRSGVKLRGPSRHWLLILRGLTGFGSLTCFYYAVTHLPLAEATVIHFTNPVLTALLAGLILGEALSRSVLAGTAAGLTGVVLMARPALLLGGWAEGLDPVTTAVAVCGAFLSAASHVCVRALARTEHHLFVVFYFPLVSVPAAAVTAIPQWVWPTTGEWLLLLGIGAATQLGQVFMTKGYYRETAGRASSIAYLQLVFATLWGVLAFGDVPGVATWVGGLLIVLGSLTVVRYRPRQEGALPAGQIRETSDLKTGDAE